MTDTPLAGRKEILGVGTLIGATFSIFFSRIMAVFALAIVPAIGLVVFQFLITPDEAAIDTNVVSFGGEGLSMPVAISVQAIVSALLVRMAYDARLGKPPLLGNYVSTTVSLIVPILGCSFVVVFVLFVVMLVIIVPGLMLAGTAPSPAIVIPFVLLGFAAMLYILAMWSAVTPSIVIERAGFRSLKRSLELTRGYRWRIAGVYILLLLILLIPIFLFSAVVMSAAIMASGSNIVLFILFTQSLGNGLVMAVVGIGTALIYARLREIKEGASMESLAEVFA